MDDKAKTRSTARLTEAQLFKAGKAGRVDKRDPSTPGLRLRCFPDRVVADVTYTCPRTHKRRTMDVGELTLPKDRRHRDRASTFTLEDARRKAREIREQVRQGVDPRAEREAGVSVREAAERALTEHWQAKRSDRTTQSARQLITRWLGEKPPAGVPPIGSMPIAALDTADVERWHAAISKTAPKAANRAVLVLSKVCNLAERWKLRKRGSNPCTGIEKNPEQRRERVLSRDERAALVAALDACEADGSVDPVALLVIRLILVTGLRAGEARQLRWAEVDHERGVLRIEKHKTARSHGALERTITESVGRILEQARELCPEHFEHVFPRKLSGTSDDRVDAPFWGMGHYFAQVRERAGLDAGVTAHVLRHTYASMLAEVTTLGAVVMAQGPDVHRRYQHRTGAAAEAERRLDALLGGNVRGEAQAT